MNKFKVIIVEDVPLELKGTEGIFKNDIPEAEIIGTADSEIAYWKLIKQQKPDLVLLDLGLGGSTTVGVEICRSTKEQYPDVKVLIFTGEILNEKLWVDVLDAGCEGIILKSGELLTRGDVASCMSGKKLVFNQPILQKIVDRFKQSVGSQLMHQEAMINYEIDEYDERFLRHLALGYTKEQITNLRGMPFGVKSLEKRQNELVQKLFPDGNNGMSVNATRLVVRACELRIIDMMKNSHTFSRICGYAMFLLILAQIVLVLASWLITAAMPDVFPRSLLSPEGIRWFFGTFTANLQSPWLVWLLLISIAWGTLRASGLLKYDHKVYRQRNALRLVCLEFVLFIGVMLLLTLIPHAILLNVMGGYASSSFSRSILPYICFMVIVMAQSFGVVSQRLNSIEAMGEAMADGVRLSAPLFIIYILVIQLYSSVDYLF